MATNGWIDRPDRADPNLELIDKLKRKLTYDGHKDDLRKMQQAHFNGDLFQFGRIHKQVTEKETVSRGDRTHPDLARLDELQERLTYDGWRKDFKNAEKDHLRCSSSFETTVRGIERKQKIHDGDRSDAEVQYLDSLRLSYPGWEDDMQKAMVSYLRGYSLSDKYQFSFAEKQRMYEGNRSHPRLVALDSLRLSYPGWEEDVKSYEEMHVSTTLRRFEGLRESSVQIEMFKSKQETHSTGVEDNSWMNPDQRTIVNTDWTFPGWEQEVQRVRECTSRMDFVTKLEHFQVRQMLHDNDYTRHPLLIKLNSIKLSYPGWEKDVGDVKTQLAKSFLWKKTFEDKMQGLLNKQEAYGKKEKRKEKETGLKKCVICMAAPRTSVFVPCRHMCACKSCSEKLIESNRKCPICNQHATSSMEVFFS